MARETGQAPAGACRSRAPVVVVGVAISSTLRIEEVPAVSRLRVPAVGGPAGHGDTPSAASASRQAVRLGKSSPGERGLGVSAAHIRYNTTPASCMIAGSVAAFYHLIAGFHNRRNGSTMFAMIARAP